MSPSLSSLFCSCCLGGCLSNVSALFSLKFLVCSPQVSPARAGVLLPGIAVPPNRFFGGQCLLGFSTRPQTSLLWQFPCGLGKPLTQLRTSHTKSLPPATPSEPGSFCWLHRDRGSRLGGSHRCGITRSSNSLTLRFAQLKNSNNKTSARMGALFNPNIIHNNNHWQKHITTIKQQILFSLFPSLLIRPSFAWMMQ